MMAVSELDKNNKLHQDNTKSCVPRQPSEKNNFLKDSVLSKTETLNET